MNIGNGLGIGVKGRKPLAPLVSREKVIPVKPSAPFAVAGMAAIMAVGALATSAQASAATSAPACSFAANRLVVEFAHPYDEGGRLDQPLSVTAQGTKTCVLTGRAKIRLLDENGKTLAYRFVSGAAGVTTEVGPEQQAVFDLTFATGDGHQVRPAKVRVTLPNGGGTRVIAWNSLTPATKTITVDGFRPWLD